MVQDLARKKLKLRYKRLSLQTLFLNLKKLSGKKKWKVLKGYQNKWLLCNLLKM